MKFLDPDKPSWQNGSALEVIHKIMVRPNLLKFICTHFDMNEHSTRVFRDMINGKSNLLLVRCFNEARYLISGLLLVISCNCKFF